MALSSSQSSGTAYRGSLVAGDLDLELEILQQVLKKSVIRLSIAAAGNHDQLDGTLDKIRNTVKNGVDTNELDINLDLLHAQIRQLDESADGSASDAFYACLGQEVQAFDFSISAEHYQVKLTDLVGRKLRDEFMAIQLLRLINDMAINLDRYVGINDQQLGQVREFGGRIYNRLGCDTDVSGLLSVPVLLADLEKQLGSHLEQPSECNDQLKSQTSLADISELFLLLLEHLVLPDTLYQKAGEFSQALRSACGKQIDYKGYAKGIADLANQGIVFVQNEKNELQVFIEKTTRQLADIEKYVKVSRSERQDTLSQSSLLKDSVDKSVESIEEQVIASGDIEQLKQGVQAHLSRIRESVEEYKEVEEKKEIISAEHYANMISELAGAQQQTEKLKQQLADSQSRLLRDTLTGLPNRMAFEERLRVEYTRWQRDNAPLCLAMWDIDHFKKVNDTYGHSAGDRVLKLFANVISTRLRKIDLFARVGGEEFVLLMPDTSLNLALELNNELRKNLKDSGFHYNGESCPITASVGIAEFVGGDTTDTVMKKADKSLYQSKHDGRNRCTVF